MTQCESARKDMKKRVPKVSGHTKKSQRTANASKSTDGMKMTLYEMPVAPRTQARERRPGRQLSGKRLPVNRTVAGKVKPTIRRSLDPSDSSNDSGLGFDNHMESPMVTDNLHWSEDRVHMKKQKLDVKLESDDVNENYCFPDYVHAYRDNTSLIRTAPSASLTSLTVSNTQTNTSRKAIPRCIPLLNKVLPSSPITLTTQLQTASRYSDIVLSIICQPEQQHRARYQTEGSRGAVKDRTGHGFPVVRLVGYNKPTTLQVFIGTDVGKVMPHMFYQACKVSGKNSTPCSEKKVDGTIVIELQLDPNKDMTATCDCVGILKERNVDVEHRFPDQLSSRSKKKSTRCRMAFRTTVMHDDGLQETLQVCSQPIVCTQPPGVPEISKKSLTTCPATGGQELFIIGKNFLKDTTVYFQCGDDGHTSWEKGVIPDKEFLQQTHLVCVVPPYTNPDITESVNVRLYVVSSGKTSEAHQFVYTPISGSVQSDNSEPAQTQTAPFLAKMWSSMTKQEQDVGMMPPPGTNLVPISQRRSSLNLLSSGDSLSPPMRTLKQELMDENSQNSILDPTELTQQKRYRHISESSLDVHQGDSNMSMINDNSIDMMRHSGFVENSNLTMDEEDLIEEDLMRSAIIDLRMKLPLSTVEDLVNTKEPSLATLRSFGVTESSTMALTAQSAQSIENYLTNIENKTPITRETAFIPQAENMQASSTFITQTNGPLVTQGNTFIPRAEPQGATFIPQQGDPLPPVTQVAAFPTEGISTFITQTAPILTNSIVSKEVQTTNTILPTAISPEKLDALVNCAVETHITTAQKNTDVLLTTQDVILNAPLPPIITSPLDPNQMNPVGSAIPPEIILNSQISPTLMCRTEQDKQMFSLQNTNVNVETTISITVTEPEKAILLNAAADLLQTQKQINDMQSILPERNTRIITDILSHPNSVGNSFYSSPPPKHPSVDKEITDKKSEERMIPSSFATMSENDLINIINPSCFDQV